LKVCFGLMWLGVISVPSLAPVRYFSRTTLKPR
jgi:hypothetical protein